VSPSGAIHRRRRRRPAATALLATLLALLFHASVLGFLLLMNFVSVKWPGGDRAKQKPQAVTLRNIDSRAWAKNRGQPREVERPEAQRRAEAPKKPEPRDDKNPHGQVVDVAPGNEQESPDAKFLAEKNNKVDKETKAKDQTPFYRNAMPRQTATEERTTTGKDSAAQIVVQGNNGTGQDTRPAQKGGGQRPVFDVPTIQQRDQIALKEENNKGPGASVRNQGESAPMKGNSNRLKVDPGRPGDEGEQGSAGKAGLPTLSQLMPSSAALDKIIGAAPNDHLQDVEQGDGTFLNTREWKYATFFNRVKQAVGRNWDPNEPLRQRDPTGEIYGGRDRYTILNVTLGSDGLLKDIQVQRSSGVDFLDEAAIVSFRRAQPFPNPPPGLMGSNGTVTFPFGFYLETGGRPLMRIFRNN
jgi:TonB family protein